MHSEDWDPGGHLHVPSFNCRIRRRLFRCLHFRRRLVKRNAFGRGHRRRHERCAVKGKGLSPRDQSRRSAGSGLRYQPEALRRPNVPHRDSTAWLGWADSKCAGRPARSRWCKSTTMKE